MNNNGKKYRDWSLDESKDTYFGKVIRRLGETLDISVAKIAKTLGWSTSYVYSIATGTLPLTYSMFETLIDSYPEHLTEQDTNLLFMQLAEYPHNLGIRCLSTEQRYQLLKLYFKLRKENVQEEKK